MSEWITICKRSPSEELMAFRQPRYKALAVESTCRKFLDALARRIRELYEFPTPDEKLTIGQVLHIKNTKKWSFKKAAKDMTFQEENGTVRRIRKGNNIMTTPLTHLFSSDIRTQGGLVRYGEWTRISHFNNAINVRIHEAKVPTAQSGSYYVMLPSDMAHDMGTFLQKVAARVDMFPQPGLIVKYEKVLSRGPSLTLL